MSSLPSQAVASSPAGSRAAVQNPTRLFSRKLRSAFVLGAIVAVFLLIECFVPLSTAVRIGADEGFNLAKATLCLNGHKLYSEIWNDQPPLHTIILTKLLAWQQRPSRSNKLQDQSLGSHSAMIQPAQTVLLPRLLTIISAVALVSGFFVLVLHIHGLAIAALATTMVVASPGFIELASSCMLEIPAVAGGMAGLCAATLSRKIGPLLSAAAAGACFGTALMIKFSPALLIPIAAFIICSDLVDSDLSRHCPQRARVGIRTIVVLLAATALAFVFVDLVTDSGAYLQNFQQSWTSHFAPARSFEYGSARDHRLDWMTLLKNWDAVAPALAALWFTRHEIRCKRFPINHALPFLWLGWALAFFAIHHPWWAYYYIHIAVPLCWCAAVGFAGMFRRFAGVPSKRSTKAILMRFATIPLLACSLTWAAARLPLQVLTIRRSPQIYSDLVLEELLRFRPYSPWFYTDDIVYSFHSGIPIPPSLAVVSLKRLWSGDMTTARLAATIEDWKPGLILLRAHVSEAPLQPFLGSEYRLVFHDEQHKLYALRAISRKPYSP